MLTVISPSASAFISLLRTVGSGRTVIAECRGEGEASFDDETVGLGHGASGQLRVLYPVRLPRVLRVQIAIDNNHVRLNQVKSAGHEHGRKTIRAVRHELCVSASDNAISYLSGDVPTLRGNIGQMQVGEMGDAELPGRVERELDLRWRGIFCHRRCEQVNGIR